ncbi:hypothetical protein MBLNU459_g6672t1 [Dothideomycetes sp. NU459]
MSSWARIRGKTTGVRDPPSPLGLFPRRSHPHGSAPALMSPIHLNRSPDLGPPRLHGRGIGRRLVSRQSPPSQPPGRAQLQNMTSEPVGAARREREGKNRGSTRGRNPPVRCCASTSSPFSLLLAFLQPSALPLPPSSFFLLSLLLISSSPFDKTRADHGWRPRAGDPPTDAVLTSKWNKPFPVTLIPSAIGLYLADKQGERQKQILTEIRALGDKDLGKVAAIEEHPK